MTASTDLVQFSFHDASLVAAHHHGSTLELTIDYFDANDAETSVSATISGIDSINRNDVLVEKFEMETPDGEIYRFVQDGHELNLVVFWHKYLPSTKTMQTYKLYGEKIHVRLTKIDQHKV